MVRDRLEKDVESKVAWLTNKYGQCCDGHKQYKKGPSDNNKDRHEQRVRDSDPVMLDTIVVATKWSDADTSHVMVEGDREVRVYGDVQLDDDETLVLRRRPEYAQYERTHHVGT